MSSYMSADESWLVDIRQRAQDLGNAEDWQAILAMEPQLRRDADYWPQVWAPLHAVAARMCRRADARSLLDDLVDAGFSQPWVLEPELSRAFGDEPDWPQLLQRMHANVPPPPVVLLDWPKPSFGPPLQLTRLPGDSEVTLRRQLPMRLPGAWDTALSLLAWVCDRWKHANDHVGHRDAVEILKRVDSGERFACVAYSIVLAQALCALGIPARVVAARARDHHVGMGKGHVVSEAWIDELGAWVVLDGQNGMYWTDATGTAMGIAELQAAYAGGGPPAGHHCVGSKAADTTEASFVAVFRRRQCRGSLMGERLRSHLPGRPHERSRPIAA